MRIVLTVTACVLAALLGIQFAGEPRPSRPFENMTIVLLSGSDETSGMDRVLAEGVYAAEQQFGCEVELRLAHWAEDRMVGGFQQVMSSVPDAICITGYPAQAALLPHIEDARDQEIIVTSFNAPFEDAEKRFSREGFGFVGLDGYRAGFELISAVVKKHGLSSGAVGMLVGDVDHPARTPFRDGCLAALEGTGITMDRVSITPVELSDEPEELVALLADRRETGTLPDFICLTEGSLGTMVRRLREAGLDADDTRLVGIAVTPETDNWLRQHDQPYVDQFISQNLSLQAYLTVVQACLSKAHGAQGLHINTPFEIVDLDVPEATPDARTPYFVQRY